ncbi:hypothetical protein Pcinc_041123 [Petrolisthes cinctipes]|uniref:G-protein coupled receptors family 1 profile domain-containing protein n=1 Tax=Petrolisthes cinctipes TaxID=88211 RepID=A0AAE1EHB8_PETCI|nr:hypothetical protein Pcinc_041123 [Petrolisthes cinctipes]
MACLREGVSSIIIHVLTLCCIVVSVCHQTATDGDGFNPTAMPASGITGKPFPSRTEHFNTNEDSGRLEVSIGSEEGREEEGSEKGERRRMAGLDDERKLFTGHVPNITLIEITDDNNMEDGSENVTAESGRDAEELNTTKSVRDAEEIADRLVGCNYAGLQEDSVMDKESDGRTNSHDTSIGKYRYAQFDDDELTTTQSTQVQNTNVQAIGPIPSNAAESSCFSSLPRTTKNAMLFYPERDDLVKVTINKFWPTCLYNMMVMTYKENATYVTDWWYLNPSCKRNEILLLVSSIVVTVITLAGNIFVLSVMITSGLLHDTTFMIRASLASADLLMGLIPAALAVYDQFGLMNGRLTLQNLNEDILLTNIPYIIASQSQGFQQLRFQRNGLLPILACFSFNVSTMVSLLTLAILSLERLCVMRGRPLPRTFMVKSIILSWTAGLLLSFLVNWRKEGIYFTGYFDPITKLTLNIGANAPSVSRWVFYLELCVMGLAGTIVIVCGTATLILFVFHHRLTSAVLSIHSCNRDSELRRTTIVFVLMVVMFTVTVGLVLVDICADLAVTKPLAHWLFWWGFVAASSWNWALYTLSGGRFREQIRSSLSCRRVQCLQKQSPSSPPPHCTQQQHISLGSNMFGVMFGREKALQVELKSFSNTLKDINFNE